MARRGNVGKVAWAACIMTGTSLGVGGIFATAASAGTPGITCSHGEFGDNDAVYAGGMTGCSKGTGGTAVLRASHSRNLAKIKWANGNLTVLHQFEESPPGTISPRCPMGTTAENTISAVVVSGYTHNGPLPGTLTYRQCIVDNSFAVLQPGSVLTLS